MKNFIPPHSAVLCNQDRQRFFRLHERLIEKYQPHDHTEAIVVRKIADAEWRALTFSELFTAFWNKELMEKFEGKQHPIPEIAEVLGEVLVYQSQANHPAVEKMHERIQKALDRTIVNNEKRLILLRKHFPSASSVIERREFDRERRDFYRSHPELLERTGDSPEPAKADESPERVVSPELPKPATSAKSSNGPTVDNRGIRPPNEANSPGPPREEEAFQLVEQ